MKYEKYCGLLEYFLIRYKICKGNFEQSLTVSSCDIPTAHADTGDVSAMEDGSSVTSRSAGAP